MDFGDLGCPATCPLWECVRANLARRCKLSGRIGVPPSAVYALATSRGGRDVRSSIHYAFDVSHFQRRCGLRVVAGVISTVPSLVPTADVPAAERGTLRAVPTFSWQRECAPTLRRTVGWYLPRKVPRSAIMPSLPGPPMTLGNMRSLGVRSLAVTCEQNQPAERAGAGDNQRARPPC